MADDFTALSHALPPQNVEAEESILGGILLDPEAMGRVADLLTPEAFYNSIHRRIYRAALTVHRQGKPTDLMTVTSWLQDQGELEGIGGTGTLAQLVDRTVSAVNIDRYATLIVDKYVRRQLIAASYEIAELGYDTTQELEQVLDQSEQKVFSLTQERPQQGLVHISESLIQTFEEIENQQDETTLPGLSCGFYDLDAMTSGFQRSDLVIIAGRPSMGKCLTGDTEIVLANGAVQTLADIYRHQTAELLTLGDDWRFHWTQPSVYVDDGIKPVFEVKTRTGRRIETTLSHPFLTIQGWRSLSHLTVGQKIAVPRHLPVFGTTQIPVEQIKLLAYFIGDGCLTHTSPQFTNANPIIREDFTTAALTFPGIKLRYADSQGTRTSTLHVTSDSEKLKAARQIFAEKFKSYLKKFNTSNRALAKMLDVSPGLITLWKQGKCAPSIEVLTKLCEIFNVSVEDLSPGGLATIRWMSPNTITLWLKSLNLWGKSAHSKCIPELIFTLERSQVALFLNRLFATDGWATVLKSGQPQLGYASVSETLARQIQHLLLRFGIIARLKSRSIRYQDHRRPAWQLDITDHRSLQIFTTDIGIFGKEVALDKIKTALSQRRPQTNCDLIPVEVWQTIAAAKGQESWKSLATRAEFCCTSNIHVGKRALSRQRLLALATALEDPELRAIATSDVYWDEIVAITPKGNKQVYDLTIPDHHNFVANDICVHNTSFALNVAANIAKIHQLPIAIFSLEMSKEQLAQRLLAGEAAVESNRLRSGRIDSTEMDRITAAIGTLSELPIYIDDSATLSVLQLRSQVRRLQAEKKGQIGVVLIDYLQLMEGTTDNRVQELSKMTRSLKGLAREVNAPVLVLSQLSRGVESRTNKRPMMSDLRECVTGDTLVCLADGRRVAIANLVGQMPDVISMNEHGRLIPAKADCVWEVGVKPVFELTTVSGRKIKATGKHRLYTFNGWQSVHALNVGDRLAVANSMPMLGQPTQPWPDLHVILLAHLIGDGSYLTHQPLRYTTASEENSAIVKQAAESFGCVVNRHASKGNWHQLVISGNGNRWHPAGVGRWLKELGIFNQRSSKKQVPVAVFQLPDDQIALFVRHLWATDGCISNYHHPNGKKYKASIFFSTVSELLARDVVALLARLRINSTMRWTKSNCYTVQIYGKTQQLKFLQLVGAFGPRVLPAEVAKAELLKRGKANPNRDTIPIEVFGLVKSEMKAKGISQRRMATLRGTSYGGTSHFKFAPTRDVLASYANILDSPTLTEIVSSDLYWDEIAAIKPVGAEPVYDLTVPGPASWLADGIVSHNSGSIEQDADLILMLYRDAYYNPDSPDRNVAEAIIVKHRNGPTGTVRLLFRPELTQFENLAGEM